MAIFNSYVSLPEGTLWEKNVDHMKKGPEMWSSKLWLWEGYKLNVLYVHRKNMENSGFKWF